MKLQCAEWRAQRVTLGEPAVQGAHSSMGVVVLVRSGFVI